MMTLAARPSKEDFVDEVSSSPVLKAELKKSLFDTSSS